MPPTFLRGGVCLLLGEYYVLQYTGTVLLVLQYRTALHSRCLGPPTRSWPRLWHLPALPGRRHHASRLADTVTAYTFWITCSAAIWRPFPNAIARPAATTAFHHPRRCGRHQPLRKRISSANMQYTRHSASYLAACWLAALALPGHSAIRIGASIRCLGAGCGHNACFRCASKGQAPSLVRR